MNEAKVESKSGEQPKKRGRPFGSKNMTAGAAKQKKKRGRPAKVKSAVATSAPRRGRKPGSKNKPKNLSAPQSASRRLSGQDSIETMIRGILDLTGPTEMKMELIKSLIAKF